MGSPINYSRRLRHYPHLVDWPAHCQALARTRGKKKGWFFLQVHRTDLPLNLSFDPDCVRLVLIPSSYHLFIFRDRSLVTTGSNLLGWLHSFRFKAALKSPPASRRKKWPFVSQAQTAQETGARWDQANCPVLNNILPGQRSSRRDKLPTETIFAGLFLRRAFCRMRQVSGGLPITKPPEFMCCNLCGAPFSDLSLELRL